MRKNLVFVMLTALTLSSCIKEDYFGFSPFGNIKSIEVNNQASQATINSNEKRIEIEFPGGVDLTNLTIQRLTLSSFATSDRNIGDQINLSDSALINITAEDGTVTQWVVRSFVASANPQLSNSDFQLWYQTSQGYYEPGENAENTIWGTGNPGTQILGLYATVPIEREEGNYAPRIETLYNGDLAAAFGTPISAGTIYTGFFDPDNLDLNDPQAAIDFGTPFAGRPLRYNLKYSYIPGPENKDRDGDPLSYGDAADIYCLLEVRSGNTVRRLATAWYREENSIEDLSDLTVDFLYGELPPGTPEYMIPENGLYVPEDSASFIFPTHLTFVASSSFDGANFAGAVGSLLVIDDLELIYD